MQFDIPNPPAETGIKFVPTTECDDQLDRLAGEPQVLANLSESRIKPDSRPENLYYRVVIDNQLAGEVRFKNIRWINRKAELSLFLSPHYQSKGIGKKIVSCVIDYLFEKLNFHRLEAEVFAYNKTAILLFKSMGFQQEGILREARFHNGNFHDIYHFGLLADEYAAAKQQSKNS